MMQRDNKMNVLFVCTGNTCRSPMAEGYSKSLKLPDINVFSAGLAANGEPASINSILCMQETGTDISSHISSPLTLQLLKTADVIYTMTASHCQIIKNIASSVGISHIDIKTLDSCDIIDPFGGDIDIYRQCREQIINAINTRFSIEKKEIVYLTQSHAKAIAELELLCFNNPWSESNILDSIKGKNTFMGIKNGEQLIGYLSFYESCGEVYINNIATNPNFRRKGIAKALLCELISLSVSSEFSFVTLEVRESNIPAISLYTSFGFKEEGRRKNYYDAPKEDAIILTRRFN